VNHARWKLVPACMVTRVVQAARHRHTTCASHSMTVVPYRAWLPDGCGADALREVELPRGAGAALKAPCLPSATTELQCYVDSSCRTCHDTPGHYFDATLSLLSPVRKLLRLLETLSNAHGSRFTGHVVHDHLHTYAAHARDRMRNDCVVCTLDDDGVIKVLPLHFQALQQTDARSDWHGMHDSMRSWLGGSRERRSVAAVQCG
jgi:hypothetical protein